MTLKTKSVWSSIDKGKDGLRILATRSPGMFLPKTRYDVWMPNLGPSAGLLRQLWAEKVSWAEFLRKYKKELVSDAAKEATKTRHKNKGQTYTLKLIKRLSQRGNVTLLCHCDEDEEFCHRHTLQQVIRSAKT